MSSGWSYARRLEQSVDILLGALREALEYCEDCSDVRDGPDGPMPNRAMLLVDTISEAIFKATGEKP
jgi:hypothetical protein